MIAFVLHDTRVETVGDALDRFPFRGRAAIADPSVARHPAGQAGHRQAGLPVVLHRRAQRLDLGIREDGERARIRALAVAAFGHEEHDKAERHTHLARGETGAAGVFPSTDGRRVGKKYGGTCRVHWSPYTTKKKKP